MVRLLQQLVLECLSLNAWVVAKHVAGVSNKIVDSLFCSQLERFRSLAPKVDEEGMCCPEHLWGLLDGL